MPHITPGRFNSSTDVTCERKAAGRDTAGRAGSREDLVDQLFNSSERRLARTLLLLANFDEGGMREPIIGTISQETLAGIVGTTRSRISKFMNKFRKLGLIDYNGQIVVHSSLLKVVLNDNPHLKTRTEPSNRSSGRATSTA